MSSQHPNLINPSLLLNPRGASGRPERLSSVPAPGSGRASPKREASIAPNFVFSSFHGGDSSSDEEPAAGISSLIERNHNVVRRDAHPAKKVKTNGQEQSSVQIHGGGEAGDYMREQRKKGEEKEHSTQPASNTVDLTQDDQAVPQDAPVDLTQDDELEVLGAGAVPEGDVEVCYGKVMKAQVHAHTIPLSRDPRPFFLDGKQWKPVPCRISRQPGAGKSIYVRDVANNIFGCVDIRTALPLCGLLDTPHMKISVDSRVEPHTRNIDDFPGKAVSEHWPLSLILYGPKKHAEAVGKALRVKFVDLGYPPTVRNGREVCNPHATEKQNKRLRHPMYSSGGQTVMRTNEEISLELNRIFSNMSSPDDLPQIDMDDRILTPLLDHQKQAIWFMDNRESIHPISEGEPHQYNPLWRASRAPNGRLLYYNVITGTEMREEPRPVFGGVIADQMGLGKTLEAIAFIVHSLGDAAQFVDTADTAYGTNGKPLQSIKTTLLVCPKNVTSNWEEQIATHVKEGVLNVYTYHGSGRQTKISELAKYDVIITTYSTIAHELKRQDRSSIFREINWFRVILDEAHAIREQSTLQSQAICSLYASRRWALTGTPVQNRIEDFGALIKFLRIVPFDNPQIFNQYITSAFKVKDAEAYPKLQLLVHSITLRRLKDKLSELPPRESVMVKLKFSPEEASLYNYFAQEAHKKVAAMTSQNKGLGKMYYNVLRSILCLRLISVHGPELLSENDRAMMQGVTSDTAIDIEGIDEDQPVLVASQAYEMFMLMCEAARNHCYRCQRTVEPREDDEEQTVFGTMLGCYDIICNTCLPAVKREIEASLENGRYVCPFCEAAQRVGYFGLTQEGVSRAEEDRDLARRDPKQAFGLRNYTKPSTKVLALVKELLENQVESASLPAGEPPIKSIVFSEWTSNLDLIERGLQEMMPDLKYLRFDGKMSRKKQKEALEQFKQDNSFELMLVSIKAGGVGLNLTTASRVYLMEPQWNPAAEEQALDRVHRLGQKRPVKIVRFIIEGGIEESMLKTQSRKKKLAEMSMNRKVDRQAAKKERLEELREIFGKTVVGY